jgi:hypothetical protein
MVIAQGGYEEKEIGFGILLSQPGLIWFGLAVLGVVQDGYHASGWHTAITVESWCGMLSKEEDVAIHMGMIKSVMRFFKMLPGEPNVAKTVSDYDRRETLAKKAGFSILTNKIRTKCEKRGVGWNYYRFTRSKYC